MTINGLDHAQILAPPGSEEEARAFFGGVLGLEEVPKPPRLAERGGVWFACGPQQLHVSPDAEFTPARRAHPAFRVEDLESLRARLEEVGVAQTDDDAIPGVRRFYVHDPFGNRLEFMETA